MANDMALLDLGFHWPYDPAGYRLLADEGTKPPEKKMVFNPLFGREIETETSLLQRAGRAERIIPCSSNRKMRRPLVEQERLYLQFIKVNSSDDLLDFANNFGPLTTAGNTQHGEDVPPLLRQVVRMKQVVRAGHSRKKLAHTIGEGIALTTRMARLDAALVLDSKGRQPRLRIDVPNLLIGLWLQLVQDLAGGLGVKACDYCGTPFNVGPGSRPIRRADARFCCDEHRIKFNSLRRSK